MFDQKRYRQFLTSILLSQYWRNKYMVRSS